ncbi:MAG: bifunctional ADP-dependent NAD(P)H-hydrate dehydratase/NAD(P)H-hydrate epimerase [Acidimicrobiales bacterium]
MRPVLTVAEMREADAGSPVAVDVLIQRAGRSVANEALRLLGGGYGRRVAVVCGPGNNGADGRTAASCLAARGAAVRVIETAARPDRVTGADLVIDAAFGTGLRSPYPAPDVAGAPVLAVDIPSGVDGDTGVASHGSVRAVLTVTLAALKPGLLLADGPSSCGRVVVADIGLPFGVPAAHLVEDTDLRWLPARGRNAHKWATAVWVVAGSAGMRGAPQLCSQAAQRAGAGMVRVGTPGLSAGEHPPGEAVAVGLPEHGWEERVASDLERFKALVIGPGLGRSEELAASVRALVGSAVAGRATIPTVVDADGLYALGRPGRLRADGDAPMVLTPHDGEFARLVGHAPGADRIAEVRALAVTTGATVLLKGPTTVVADPGGRVLLCASGDARLATAGTGDVLSGIVGAFLAAGLGGLEAAALGAHVHGLAARRGAPVGLVAGDLPDLIPSVLEGSRMPAGLR